MAAKNVLFCKDLPLRKFWGLLSYIAPRSHVFKYILLKLAKIPITFYVLHKYSMCGSLQYIICFYFNIKISIEGLESFLSCAACSTWCTAASGAPSGGTAPLEQTVLARRLQTLLRSCRAKSRWCQMENEGDSMPSSICFKSSLGQHGKTACCWLNLRGRYW